MRVWENEIQKTWIYDLILSLPIAGKICEEHFWKVCQTKQELARPEVTTWAREEGGAAFMKALINPPSLKLATVLPQIPILNAWLIFSPFNMYELFSGNIWHSIKMISARERGAAALGLKRG
jgi:hypothetical protein